MGLRRFSTSGEPHQPPLKLLLTASPLKISAVHSTCLPSLPPHYPLSSQSRPSNSAPQPTLYTLSVRKPVS